MTDNVEHSIDSLRTIRPNLTTGQNPAEQLDPDSPTVRVQEFADTGKPRPPRTRHLNVLGVNSIAFYIDTSDEPLVVQITRQISLGRRDTVTGSQPSVDLTPYNVFALGVSRFHALIRRENNDLLLEDLGSSNGTYVNGKRVVPRYPHELHSGDLIVLGKLSIELYFTAFEEGNLPSQSSANLPNNTPLKDTSFDSNPILVQHGNLQVPPKTLPDISAGSVALPSINGCIRLTDPDSGELIVLAATVVINPKMAIGAGKSPSLGITVVANANHTEQQINDLLERRLNATGLTLTVE